MNAAPATRTIKIHNGRRLRRRILLEIFGEGLFPVMLWRKLRIHQHRVRRPLSRERILFRRTWMDFHGDARLTKNLTREVVPRDSLLWRLVGYVIDARCSVAFQDLSRRLRKIAGISRLPMLVVDDLKFITLTPKPQHRVNEVLSVRPVEPGCADEIILQTPFCKIP